LTQPAHVQTSNPRRKLGRLAPHPESTHPSLKMADFLRPGYALTVPAVIDYLTHVTTWPMYGNDTLGDCTAAAAGHQREAWTSYGRGVTTLTDDADVLSFYEACSGYIPGRPDTDNGAVMQDCCNYWRKTGLAGDRILAFFKINPANIAEVKAALYLFGGCYVGINIPTSALDQFDAGKPWDYQPTLDNSIEGGHCVHLGAMDASGVMTVTTWGRTQLVTPAWWNHFTEECWGLASLDWINTAGVSPEGLDTAALNAQYQVMNPGQPGPFPTLTPPAPPTPAPPAPTPTPPAPPTPTPPAVSVADQALANSVPSSWLAGHHVAGNATVQTALKEWFTATGLTPGGK
jgi:hypothetical protein